MKIIFLDFDGVINTRLYDPKREKIRYFFPEEDGRVNNRHAVDFINKLILDTSAVIVVSSTWRIGESIESLQRMLVDSGCIGRVIGKTYRLNCDHSVRGDEIQLWLDDHQDIESYVIIDDVDEMLKSQMKNFVKCDENYGFMFPEYIKALHILNNITFDNFKLV